MNFIHLLRTIVLHCLTVFRAKLLFLLANFEEDVVEQLPSEFECGIYCGWASVDNGPVYKMVMSIGFNPFYNNTKKAMVCSSSTVAISLYCVIFTVPCYSMERYCRRMTSVRLSVRPSVRL